MADGQLLADALRALGRRPGDYSNKVDTDITAAMPASAAAAAILLRLLDTVEANVRGVLARHRHRVPARPAGRGAADPRRR